MIRDIALAVCGALVIVAGAALVLAFAQPVLAAPCAGRIVTASWYGAESGHRTASGLRFDGSQWLVAHKSLPFGTKLRLTYRGRSVIVPVQDRGPYIRGRTLDLSEAVARALGTKAAGAARVCMEKIGP
jgi:rare lipoprotein A